MSKMSSRSSMADQYSSSEKLVIRQNLHKKHSTNKGVFADWLFGEYDFPHPCKVLELGCGAGDQWEHRLESMPAGSVIVLSDLSMGMVETVWSKFKHNPNVIALQIDAQNLPFPDSSFDVIIANHMLYHMPDLRKTICEIHRVLKPGGTFYAATNGSEGMTKYLHLALQQFDPAIDAFGDEHCSFTIQNGKLSLSECFHDVVWRDYEDSLAITETQDLIDWIKSSISMVSDTDVDISGLFDHFESIRLRDGAIHIPKQVGLFISRKSPR